MKVQVVVGRPVGNVEGCGIANMTKKKKKAGHAATTNG